MHRIMNILHMWTMAYFSVLYRYAKWTEDNYRKPEDLWLFLGLPVLFFGVIPLLLLPIWASKLLAAIMLVPFIYAAYLLFQFYWER